jgi:ribosome-binding factor A
MPHLRRERVGDLVKREIAQIIEHELKDPGIGFVTLTGVDMSGDLRQAKVFYSVLGDQDSKEKSAAALGRARGFVQREIGRRLRLRYTPEISFCFDASVERGAHIEELIQRMHSGRETEEREAGSDPEPGGGLPSIEEDDDEGQTQDDSESDRPVR